MDSRGKRRSSMPKPDYSIIACQLSKKRAIQTAQISIVNGLEQVFDASPQLAKEVDCRDTLEYMFLHSLIKLVDMARACLPIPIPPFIQDSCAVWKNLRLPFVPTHYSHYRSFPKIVVLVPRPLA